MERISVIICSHNPRLDYLARVLSALKDQTLSREDWELLLVDNASREALSQTVDVRWHERGRHVREDQIGLTWARLRGIRESSGQLLVFVDDDNILAPDYLATVLAIHDQHPFLGALGSGRLEPQYEVDQQPDFRIPDSALALRRVPLARWSNNPRDVESIPWGAGLCVTRAVAESYVRLVEGLGSRTTAVLGRRGKALFCGDDDLFSFAALSLQLGFGVFPRLRVTHLIPAGRLTREYVLRRLHDHAMSHSMIRYRLAGLQPARVGWFRYIHLALHGLRNGVFSMRCQWSATMGEAQAARLIADTGLEPAGLLNDFADFETQR